MKIGRRIFAILGGLVLIYLLSVGPVYGYLFHKDVRVPDAVQMIYSPLIRAAIASQFCQQIVFGYIAISSEVIKKCGVSRMAPDFLLRSSEDQTAPRK